MIFPRKMAQVKARIWPTLDCRLCAEYPGLGLKGKNGLHIFEVVPCSHRSYRTVHVVGEDDIAVPGLGFVHGDRGLRVARGFFIHDQGSGVLPRGYCTPSTSSPVQKLRIHGSPSIHDSES